MPFDHARLVELIYDCAEDERGLDDALAETSRQLDAEGAHTLVIERGLPLAENHFHGHDGSEFLSYDRDWRDKDPRFAAANQRHGEVLSDVAVVDPTEFERSAIYNEFLAPRGVRYTLFANATAGPELMIAQAFMRPKSKGPFFDDEIRMLSAVLPHFARAVRLRQLAASLREQREDLQRTLDALDAPVALLDRAGRVLCASAAAEALFATSHRLITERGVLTARSSGEARALTQALGCAAALAEAHSYRPPPTHLAPTVSIARDGAEPLTLVFFPLRPRSGLRAHREARVLAVVHDPARVTVLDPGLVAKLHGLTATEAEVATTLAAGGTLVDFARERGCTELTARTHLKRVFQKTGTARQADLVRVLLTGAAARLTR